ncbi:MAG TPA: tRNA (adenosine(37)-N6)-dimethylallyltransferase MiaA [Actinomycetota bacterium]|nr:tRNA (adenosine(37)-N6)-dimethylallyltransferase MiaA [Actinomycetota bacterium]
MSSGCSRSPAPPPATWRAGSSSSSPPRVLAIVGPTAAGKSALAMRLAPEIGAEIVSVDSAAIYRGMDIGTDKPSAEDRARVPHHLLDIADPDETPTVAQFQERGRACVDEILNRGRVPLLVGGSGLYFRAIVDPLEFPPTDPEVRGRLEAEAYELGGYGLFERLEAADPEAASRMHPANVRRTIRALEVIEVTGRPFSSYRVAWDDHQAVYDLRAAGLDLPFEQMAERIDARVDALMARGWVAEVAALREAGVRFSATSLQALGYAQILDHLDGRLPLDQAIEETKRRTRKFARRQLRWFRADPRIRWFPDPAAAAEYLTEPNWEEK